MSQGKQGTTEDGRIGKMEWAKSRAWVSAALLSSGVQSGALFLASATRAPLNYSKKSVKWAPFAKIGKRKCKTRSFCSSLPQKLFNFVFFLHFYTFLNFPKHFEYFLFHLKQRKVKHIFRKNPMKMEKCAEMSATLFLESMI